MMDSTITAALIGVAIGGAMPWPLKAGWRLLRGNADMAQARARLEAGRISDLEDLVDLLRRELDKSLVRGNATLTMARILLFAVDQEPRPSPSMIAARDQARRVIAAADEQIKRGA